MDIHGQADKATLSCSYRSYISYLPLYTNPGVSNGMVHQWNQSPWVSIPADDYDLECLGWWLGLSSCRKSTQSMANSVASEPYFPHPTALRARMRNFTSLPAEEGSKHMPWVYQSQWMDWWFGYGLECEYTLMVYIIYNGFIICIINTIQTYYILYILMDWWICC